MNYQYILDQLPYTSGFRFVDGITHVDENGIIGYCTLRPDAFFYAGHFPGNPVTPGAILTEVMAQIGLVALGIFLVSAAPDGSRYAAGPPDGRNDAPAGLFPLLTSADSSFLKLVLPGEKVTVISKKVYFRFDKLKCKVEMRNAQDEPVAKAVVSGMIRKITK
ncbi:MAG TPA: hypothetical protein VN616_04390 [Puia sp.]|nr:hypothetical protein [Puia sp.]